MIRDLRGAIYSFRFSVVGFIVIMLVLLLVPTRLSSLFAPGSTDYTPLVSLFISAIKADLLPHGWILLAIQPDEPLEIYIVASAVLAFLLDSPLFSFDAARFLMPARQRIVRRWVYPFVLLILSLLTVGTSVGYYLVVYQIEQLAYWFSHSPMPGPPILDGASFYFLVLRSIAAIGFAFMFLGVAYMLFRFRTNRWHTTVSSPGLVPISEKMQLRGG